LKADGLDVKALKDVDQFGKLLEKWIKDFDNENQIDSGTSSPFLKDYIFISSDSYINLLLEFINDEREEKKSERHKTT